MARSRNNNNNNNNKPQRHWHSFMVHQPAYASSSPMPDSLMEKMASASGRLGLS